MKKALLVLTAVLSLTLPSFSQSKLDLSVTVDDIYILPGDENGPAKDGAGYHLYIRKKAGMESVMLIESNKDPAGKQTNYAYRAEKYNKINGDEIRYLNGKVLESKTARYSLIDSTPEKNDKFGQCFHIYIPETVVFGYPWARNGAVHLSEGIFVNIRAFSKKYADYSGNFMDNSFNFSKGKSKESKKTQKKIKSEPEKNIAETLPEILAKNDTSAGNYAEKLEAYNSSYITEDEVDLEQIASEPFEEEDLPDFMMPPEDFESEETEDEDEPAADEDESAVAEPVEVKKDKDIPSAIPFEEEDLPAEPEPEPEPEEEFIPEDERDVISEVPYDEVTAVYDPDKLGKSWVRTEDKDDPVKPFLESMEGVDPDFVAKLEQAEAAKQALEEMENEPEEPVKVELGKRFVTHAIEMVKIEGSKKMPDMYVSKTEVTQQAYRMVTGVNPSTNQGDYYPVETVSWYDVIVFCNLLSIRDGLVPCYSINEARNPGAWGEVPRDNKKQWKNIQCDFSANGYRMLTIEEWEYFAAGGPEKQSGKYAGSNYIDDVAWYKNNSEVTTHIVGMKMPNACGLYDMCGNVSEWCWGNTGNPERPAAVRGGNYSYESKYCKLDFKDACQAWYAHFENGIRICRNAE